MALWQLDLYLYPSFKTLPDTSINGWVPPTLNGENLLDLQRVLRSYLGDPWHVMEHWCVFGPEEGSRADVIFESEKEAAVVIRLDMRNEDAQFAGLACRLAHQLNCQFFAPELDGVVEPHHHALRFAIADATAARFEKYTLPVVP